jgi:hypothetical protein
MDAHASVYGGTFFRDDHGYVGFVADAPKHLAELRALTSDPGFFIAYCAPFSIAQQRTVSDAVPHDAVLQAHGVEVIGSGLDEAHGRVEVQVTKITKDTVSLLHQRYGDIIGQVDPGDRRGTAPEVTLDVAASSLVGGLRYPGEGAEAGHPGSRHGPQMYLDRTWGG